MYRLQIQIQDFKNINNLKNKLIFIQQILKIKKQFSSFIIKKKKIYTLLRSPHVNKKSREQFIYQKYKKNYFIFDNNLYKLLNLIIILKNYKIFIFNIKLVKI